MLFDQNKKPAYIFSHPFRFVKPYAHIFETHAKQRWLGKNLLATLSKQFQAYSEQYFREAIKAGKVLINGKKVDPQYVIKNSDLLQHQTIRQQPPILDLPIQIIHEDEDFLVVCKPPSMVVHTGGGYHYNTLMAILYYELGYRNLYILHRIDRLTSGVVILSKKRQKTTKFHEESMQEVMKKCYFARVAGNFQPEQKQINAPLICLSHREGIWGVFNPQTMKDMLKIQQPKQSITKFVKIFYDESTDSSLLQCFPVTGRTHQIRVHLSHIGHPILNDIVYNGRFVGNWIVNTIKQRKQQSNAQNNNTQKQYKIQESQKPQNKQQYQIDIQKWDYKQRPLQIFLHSYKYKFEGKQYVSSKPYWVQPNLNFVANGHKDRQKLITKQQKNKSNYELQFLTSIKQRNAKNRQNKKKQQQQQELIVRQKQGQCTEIKKQKQKQAAIQQQDLSVKQHVCQQNK